MDKLINQHTIKIQLVAALMLIGFIMYWTFIGAGYIKQIDSNAEAIKQIIPKIEKIAVLEANIIDIKDNVQDIKASVNVLIKQG